MIKVGDKIYIPSAWYISHGSDDMVGGLATISAIEERENVGVLCQFVQIKEFPGKSYNWTLYLKYIQDKLKAEFGDNAAYPDPDIDTPWIEDGDIVNGEVYRGPSRW